MIGRFRWTPPQELFLEIEVGNKSILVDPANANNKMKEAAWEEVTQDFNHTFGVSLTRYRIRKKYMDLKMKNKAKVTKAIEEGETKDGRRVAATMGQFRKHARGTGGGPAMFPPPQNVPDEETETDTDYGENYLLHKTPSTMKVMEPRKRKSIFAFATSAKNPGDTMEEGNNGKKNDDQDQGTSMQKEEVTTDSSSDTVPRVKESKRSKKKKASRSLSTEADLYFRERRAYWKKAAPLKLAALKSKAKYWELIAKDAEERIQRGQCPIVKPSALPSSDESEDDN